MNGEGEYSEAQLVERDDRPRTHVNNELSEQPELIASIQHGIAELDKRLASVLRPVDDPNKVVGEPHMPLVPLAEVIRSSNEQLRGIRTQLVSILDRLEL